MQHPPKKNFANHYCPVDPQTLRTIAVLNHKVVNEAVDPVVRTLLGDGRKSVFFLNAHCANLSVSNKAYAAALRRADYILPDGIGIELAAKMQGNKLRANLNGTDFAPKLLRQAVRWGRSVFLIGGTPGTANAAAQRLCMDIPGLRVVGTRDGFVGADRAQEAIDEINESGADIVLVAMGVPRQELWIDRHRDLIEADLVLGVGALFDFLAGNVRRAPALVRKFRMEWGWRLAMEPRRLARRYLAGNLTFLSRSASHAWRNADRGYVSQRALDIAISGGALLLLGIPMLAVAAMVRLDSSGPALFKQTRVGKAGGHFGVYKFRSMFLDAEARRAALLATSDREGVCFKSRSDPRITRMGKLLRRFSIDELPQLINVLKGEMSIVGPRPALPEEVKKYPTRALGRLDAKPGITGLWQVAGRADIGFDKMVDLDIAYVKSRSTLLDLMLIALTFRAVISGRGAY
ncbi:MAG: WecB/TagA/CpsF family glycosyltransferase [Litoreibacter sp.]|uniref:WecB/TagA/CpsF family glycosyltransferase n=1 Tax=Litoreibacter sp. TaxID=1969459 RepID=UPI00329A304F